MNIEIFLLSMTQDRVTSSRFREIVNAGPLLALVCAAMLMAAVPVQADPLVVNAQPLAPGPLANGALSSRLVWMGGLKLESPDPRFGGLSGLLVSPDGTRLTAVSDRGYWVRMRLVHDDLGRLAGVAEASIAMLRDTDGRPLRRRRDRDAESLAALPDGSVMVAFEHNHRLLRYPAGEEPLGDIAQPVEMPVDFAPAGGNSGLEALSEAGGDTILAVIEGNAGKEESAAYLRRDGKWTAGIYTRVRGFRPTGATRLPNGDLLLLERRFTLLDGIAVRLQRLPGATLVPGSSLRGEEIARLEPPAPVDNMEGLAAWRGPGGKTLIYLISDDNYSPLQRTLLLMLELRD